MVVVGDPIAEPPKLTLPRLLVRFQRRAEDSRRREVRTHDKDECGDLGDTVCLGSADGDEMTTWSEEG